jgi:tRNA nucleotidyltransferase (CCA-adding enzyme)
LLACGAYDRVFAGLKTGDKQSHKTTFEILDNLKTDAMPIKFAIWLKDEKTVQQNAPHAIHAQGLR